MRAVVRVNKKTMDTGETVKMLRIAARMSWSEKKNEKKEKKIMLEREMQP